MKTTLTILGVTVTFEQSFHGKRRQVKHAQWYGRTAAGETVAFCCRSVDAAAIEALVAIARNQGETGSVADIRTRHGL